MDSRKSAGEVNLKTCQPIWHFFTGRTVDRYIFLEVCYVLELNWREIAIAPPVELLAPGAIAAEQILDDIDVLTQYVRSQRQSKIPDQCGTLQLLDTSRSVGIDDIYINVNVVEEIASDQCRVAIVGNFPPVRSRKLAVSRQSVAVARWAR